MGHINICLTVDWEGENLDNLNDLIVLRKHIGEEIPFTHFICPNYFLTTNNTKKTAAKIKQAIHLNDEIALHIHCYKDLIKYTSDIAFRTDQNYHKVPNWLEKKVITKIIPFYKRKITGRGVPLSVYNKEEITTIINDSRNLLCEHLNLKSISGFRAGGWIANDEVLEVVDALNFKYDSSAVSPSIFSQGLSKDDEGNKKDDYGNKNGIFADHLLNLWGYRLQTSGFLKNEKIRLYNNNEAVDINTQPFKFNQLVEIPNNCGLTDYCSFEKTVIPLIKEQLNRLAENPNQSFTIVYGCHQEDEMLNKLNLIEFINQISEIDSPLIKFIKMKDVLTDFKRNE